MQRRVRATFGELAGLDADSLPYGTDGCGIPTLPPLRGLARAMASMADPSRLPGKRAEAIVRIRAAMNAEPFMVAGTGRFCTRLNGARHHRAGQGRCRGRLLLHVADLGRAWRSRCGMRGAGE